MNKRPYYTFRVSIRKDEQDTISLLVMSLFWYAISVLPISFPFPALSKRPLCRCSFFSAFIISAFFPESNAPSLLYPMAAGFWLHYGIGL